MTQENALLAIAVTIFIGSIIFSIAVFSLSKNLRKIRDILDEIKYFFSTTTEEKVRRDTELLELEKKRFEFEIKSKKPKILLIKSGNLRLYEEKQELIVGYRVENIGFGKVLINKLQIAIVNRRTPNLIKVVDMIFNRVIEEGKPLEGEVAISVKDFTRISLPFVPDFGFIKDSCRIMASLEAEDFLGETHRIDKDILEW